MPLIEMFTRVLRLLLVSLFLAGVVLGGIWFAGKPERALHGLWETEGYGLLLDVRATTIRFYELSPTACQEWRVMPAHMGFLRGLAGYSFARDGADLRIEVADIVEDIRATKRTTLPAQCVEGRFAGPRETFEIMWEIFNAHYPFFDLHDIDWAARKTTAMAEIGDTLDPAHLAQVMERALDGLADNHVNLLTPNGQFAPAPNVPWGPQKRQIWQVTDRALAAPEVIGEADIKHGWIAAAPQVAYMRIHHTEPAQSLGKQMSDAAENVVVTLSQTYADAQAVIVDLRFNKGGSDVVALAYAGLFAADPVVVGAKRTQTAPGTFTAPTPLVITPAPNPLVDRPIVVLTSADTVSSGEVLALALQALPTTTVMGEVTAGNFSDPLVRQLPNGWGFTLSHQIYEDATGALLEGRGILPDVAMPFDLPGFSAGEDRQLAAALTTLPAN